jgi:hypothetical protein
VVLEGDPTYLIDTSTNPTASIAAFEEFAASPPSQWLCVQRAPFPDDADLAGRERALGASLAVARRVSWSWPRTLVRVLVLDTSLSDTEAAFVVCDELARFGGASVVFRDRASRRARYLTPEPIPDPGRPGLAGRTVLLTGFLPVYLPLLRALTRREPARVYCLVPEPCAEAATALLARELETEVPVVLRSVPLCGESSIAAVLGDLRTEGASFELCVHASSCLVADTRAKARDQEWTWHGVDPLLELPRLLDPSTFFLSLGSIQASSGGFDLESTVVEETLGLACERRMCALHVSCMPGESLNSRGRDEDIPSLDEHGLESAPLEALCEVVLDLAAEGRTGRYLLSGRLGRCAPKPLHPFLSHIEVHGDAVSGRCTFSLAGHAWLADNLLDGGALLPLSVLIELFAAVAAHVEPGRHVAGFRDLVLEAQPRVYPDTPLELLVLLVPDPRGGLRCEVQEMRRTVRESRPRTFLSGRLLFEGCAPASPLPTIVLPEDALAAPRIYDLLHQTGCFRVLKAIPAVATDALLAVAQVEHAYLATSLLSAPLVLEAAIQAAAALRLIGYGEIPFPLSIATIDLAGKPQDGEDMNVLVLARSEGRFDVDVDRDAGHILQVRGLEFVTYRRLPPDARIPPPPGGWNEALVVEATPPEGLKR